MSWEGILGSCCLLFAVAVAFVLYMIHTLVTLWHQRKKYVDIPSPPVDNFWYGHGLTMGKAKKNNTFLDLFDKWTKAYGKSIMVFPRFRALLFTVDPNMFRVVTSDLKLFSKLNDLPNRSLFGQKIAGWDSVLTGGGHSWGIKRKIMSKFFAKANMAGAFELCKPLIQNYIRTTLKKKVGSRKILELHEELSFIFSAYPSAVGITGFDILETIAQNITTILEMIPKQNGTAFNLSRLLFGASKEKVDTINMIIEMRKKLKALVLEKSAEMEASDEGPKSTDAFGHVILANETCQFEKYSAEEYSIDDIMTIYLVMDNMVKQISSLFIYLEKYPEIYKKMATEIRDFELEGVASLTKLKYTEKVLLESLRLTPALLRGTRLMKTQDGKPCKVGDLMLPSGTQIHFSQYLIHHSEELWENADKMDPERWSNGFNPEPYTYMPFLAGPRGCLGKHFAMMTMKLTLVAILKNFELTPRFNPEKRPVFDQGMAVMRIRNRVDYEFVPV